ncbi:MAG: single-stranded DNA-binding protein, partial [Pseudomonas sp.]|nr:single-stranded DNA-binding protein [Pseudomonas sp.]
TTEIIVDMQGTMQLLGGRPDNAGGGDSAPRQQRPAPQREPQQSAPRPAPQQAPQPAADFDSFDDDIPF